MLNAAMLRRFSHSALSLSRIPFVRGVAIFQTGSGIGMVIGFLSSVLYARLLGLEAYGLFAVVSAFVGLISMFTSFGQETATTTFLAEAVGKKDATSIRRVLRYYLQATLCSTVVYVGLLLIVPLLVDLFNQNPSITLFARLLLINAMLQPINVLLFIVLQLAQRYTTIIVIENVLDALQLALSLLLIGMGWGVLGMFIGTVTITIISLPLLCFLYVRTAHKIHIPALHSIIPTIFQSGTGVYVRQGFWIALDKHIGSNIYPNVLLLILDRTASLEIAGLFRIALRLVTLPASVLMPSISRMTNVSIPQIAAQNKKSLRTSVQKVMIGSIGLSAMAAIGAAIVAPPLIPIVYGAAFAAVVPSFLLMLPINVIIATHTISVPLLRLFRKVWTISIVNSMSIAIAIGLYFLLLHRFSPLISMSFSVLAFHINTLMLFAYLWWFFRKKPSLPSAL